MLIQRLTAVPLVLCAAPEYLARRGRPQRPEELVAHDCISGITPEFQSWRFFASRAEGATEIAIPIKGRLTSRSAVLLRDAAVGGAGILLIPPRMAEADLVAGRLVPLLQEFPPAPLTLNAFFSPDQHLSNRLRATLDALIAHLSTI